MLDFRHGGENVALIPGEFRPIIIFIIVTIIITATVFIGETIL